MFIIGCPRSGTTLLYRALAEARPLWSIGGEGRHIIERHHHPAESGWFSGSLTTDDPTSESRDFIRQGFEREAAPWTYWTRINRLRGWLNRRSLWRGLKRSRESRGGSSNLSISASHIGISGIRSVVRFRNRARRGGDRNIRLLEKTPENCLRLPFLLEIFPDARFIFLTRDGRSNTSSLMEGWRRPDLFPGYRLSERIAIPGVPTNRWAFTLIPGWRELATGPLQVVCARQWIECNGAVLDFRLGHGRDVPFQRVRYEDLVDRFDEVLEMIAAFADVDLRPGTGEQLESNIVTPPDRDKWRHLHGEEISGIEELIAPTMRRLGYSDLASDR